MSLGSAAVANPKDRTSQKMIMMPSGTHKNHVLDVRHTWARPLNTQLYDDKLAEMSNQTRSHLFWLARNKMLQKPEEQRNIKQFSPDSGSHTDRATLALTQRPLSRSSWTNMSVMFNSAVDRTSRHADDSSSMLSTSSKVMNFCYLCSTMEEHQRNHLKLRVTTPLNRDGSVIQKKQRICYTAPAPSRTKKRPEEPAGTVHEGLYKEALYKVTVWTGDFPGASTDADVYIAISGDQGGLLKTKLWRRQGTNKFSFVRGSKEVFHIKGPKLGSLRSMTVEHDGLEKRHGWYLERVEVQCMLTRRVWVFLCKNWLSMHHGDCAIKRDLQAAVKEHAIREFEVVVETGKKRFAGTDANVYITVHGTEGRARKHHLNSQHQRGACFQRGQTDKFKFQVPDVGDVRSIRIEHDGEDMASSWYLNKVMLRDLHQPQCIYYFVYNGWLAKDASNGRLWCELRAMRHLPNDMTSAKPVQYEVMVKTGDVQGAGTTADIYVIFNGTRGKTSRMFLSDSSSSFERSKTESFKLRAVNVGSLKSITVGLDSSGPGAGWFCDHIRVRKSLSRQEISDKLTMLKEDWKAAKQPLTDKADDQDKQDQNSEDKNDDTKSKLNDANEPTSETPRKSVSEKRGSECVGVFNERGRVLKIPVCEEYLFPCSKWFASDHVDSLPERELDAEKPTLCYQKR